jgi:succinoglycan biosynthesis protein ExoW
MLVYEPRNEVDTKGGARLTTPLDREARDAVRIGVVIPYFQRKAGLLHRALVSVAAQEHSPVQVVVVDDGSPRPTADEITPALRSALPGLTLIRQPNQGVAVARNAALDALTKDVSAIALLDSDDYWEPRHLWHAARALSRGADFFFSNSRIEGNAGDLFHSHPQHDVLLSSQPIQGEPSIVRWRDSLSALFGFGCPFETSTVVFRRALMPEIRFSTRFRRAGEDRLACLELLIRSSVIMFCLEPTLVSGTGGVGIWKNSIWGSATHLIRLADELRFRRHMVNSHLLNPGDRRLIQRGNADRRYAALMSTLHLLRRRHNVFGELLYLFRADPACAASWCLDLPKLVWRWFRGTPVTR